MGSGNGVCDKPMARSTFPESSGSIESAATLAGGIVTRIQALSSLNTESVRAVRREFSKRLTKASSDTVVQVAQRLLADYLFSTTLANRIEATTEIENVAEHTALERAGFQREGVLRDRGFVRGQWRDGVMYARLGDAPASKPDSEWPRSWLA